LKTSVVEEPKAAGEIKPRANQDKRLYVHLVPHSNTEEGGYFTAEEWYSGQDDQNISGDSKKYARKDLTGHYGAHNVRMVFESVTT
jgi:hypothetical protein